MFFFILWGILWCHPMFKGPGLLNELGKRVPGGGGGLG
jgi:hypothetical protein